MNLIPKLLSLPSLLRYEGIEFELKVWKEAKKEIRLCYEIYSVESTSPHYDMWKRYGCWHNPILDSTCGFLFLAEGIERDSDLTKVIDGVKHFITQNKL